MQIFQKLLHNIIAPCPRISHTVPSFIKSDLKLIEKEIYVGLKVDGQWRRCSQSTCQLCWILVAAEPIKYAINLYHHASSTLVFTQSNVNIKHQKIYLNNKFSGFAFRFMWFSMFHTMSYHHLHKLNCCFQLTAVLPPQWNRNKKLYYTVNDSK